jgi:hypothetical protein
MLLLGDSENIFRIIREGIPCFFEHPIPSYWVVNGVRIDVEKKVK